MGPGRCRLLGDRLVVSVAQRRSAQRILAVIWPRLNGDARAALEVLAHGVTILATGVSP